MKENAWQLPNEFMSSRKNSPCTLPRINLPSILSSSCSPPKIAAKVKRWTSTSSSPPNVLIGAQSGFRLDSRYKPAGMTESSEN